MKQATALVTAVLLVGCAGSAPPRFQYLLRADSVGPSGRVEVPIRVGLARIMVAPYLDRAGIVVEIEPGQVQAARRHQWAEPLDAGLRSYLRAELSSQLGYDVDANRAGRVPWDYAVDIYVDRLHGTLDGTALLDASYGITAQAGEVAEYRFARSVPLPRDGYPGLVDAEVALLRALAEAIADSLRDLIGK